MKLAIVSWRSPFAGGSIDEIRNGKLVRLAQTMLTTVIGLLLSSRTFWTGL